MPNRKGFPQWMHQTFNMDKYNNGDGSFFPHQRFIRDFMQFESPYRGLLLYHGLGVGKTCASIAAAEAYISHGRKIIVMVPASLAVNYRQEIMKCATVANPSAMIWNMVEGKGKGAPRWIPGPEEEAAKYGKVLRKNVAFSKLTAAEKEDAVKAAEEIANKVFTFVNYNGLTLKAWQELTNNDGAKFFENSFIVMDEAHNFISRVANDGRVARRIYEDMMNAQGAKMVLLTGTPVINHPYELCLLLNLVRGLVKLHVATFRKTKNLVLPTDQVLRASLGEHLTKYVDHLSVAVDTRKLHFSLFPRDYIVKDGTMMIEREEWKESYDQVVQKVFAKLRAAFSINDDLKVAIHTALPQAKDEFVKMYMDMTDPDAPKVKNMDTFMRRIMGLVSYVRTTGEENFPEVERKQVEAIPMTDFQYRIYNKVRGTERNMERKQKQKSQMMRAPVDGVFGAKGTVYRAFSRMACNFVFPDDIQRKYPMDLRKELQRVLTKEMDADEEEDKAAAKILEDKSKDSEDIEEKAKEQERKLVKDYEASLKQVMKQLKERSSDILAKDKLESIYSPKLAKVVEDISSSPGKNLIYSQFRSVEGLGVVQYALEQAGHVRIELSKKGSNWGIVNAAEVLSPTYDRKRYIVFDGDREKTKMLLHLFNGEFDALPTEMTDQIREAQKSKKSLGNLRGELVATIMITQSGAEGISLKNVRRVMILEPFWNMVRMDQVIGRAVRNNSHKELPLDERKVQVFIYTTIFTKEQLAKDFTLRNEDNSMTSDMHIMQIAQNKDEIIQTFLNHMKMASVDCRIQAASNRIMKQGMRCFAFPIPVSATEESYLPDIGRDALFKSRLVRTRKIQGRVIIHKNKKYVVVDEYPGKVYNYSAYKDAGVLEEVPSWK